MVQGVTGSDLTRAQWVYAFSLVTSLFFTWGFAYGLLDVLNAHFQSIFHIGKTQSTLLQLAYFGAYLVFSPFASLFMEKYGYKRGIHLGLSLYSLGAIFFWPSAKFQKYGGFVGCTFVIGCGLCCLEVAANSYIAVLGTPKYAAARLNFSQGFQGVASFAGPMIASRWFFQGKNATSLDTVQWVYLAVAGLGLVLNILFYFCTLPEITEDALAQEMHEAGLVQDSKPFYKQYHCIFGWVAQTVYVGAQVAVAALAVNYLSEQGIGIDKPFASQLFSYCQITFTVGRFVGVVLLRWIDPALLLSFYAIACSIFALGVTYGPGRAGVGCLFALFFFESICYPVIFTLGTKNLGRHTKRGSGLIVMGVGGGAWWPPMAGAVADHISTAQSYAIPFAGYTIMAFYAIGMVISQARTGGFRLFTVDEIAQQKAALDGPPQKERRVSDSDSDKKGSQEFVETV